MYSWKINGQEEMTQQWFWYSVNSGAPQSINTLGAPIVSQPAANILDLTYAGLGFNIKIDYTLTGNPTGSYVADMGESYSIINTSLTSPLNMAFYKYTDFNLQNGQGGPNSVSITKNGLGLYNDAIQTSAHMTAYSELGNVPGSQEAEANVEFNTLSKLNGASPLLLDNVANAGPGAVTSAFEWDRSIAPNTTVQMSTDDYIQSTVPEPSVLALIPAGLALLALGKRRLRA